jgi:hypothetical protein
VFDVPEELAPDSTLKTLAKKWLTGIGRQP